MEAQQHAHMLLSLKQIIDDANRAIDELVDADAAALELSRTKGVSKQQIAAVVGELQDIRLYATEAKAASFAGLALCREQTGKTKDRKVVQHKSNRVLQAAMMSIATTRIKHDAESLTYYSKKIAEGKRHRQALRSLARHIFRRFYRFLAAAADGQKSYPENSGINIDNSCKNIFTVKGARC